MARKLSSHNKCFQRVVLEDSQIQFYPHTPKISKKTQFPSTSNQWYKVTSINFIGTKTKEETNKRWGSRWQYLHNEPKLDKIETHVSKIWGIW